VTRLSMRPVPAVRQRPSRARATSPANVAGLQQTETSLRSASGAEAWYVAGPENRRALDRIWVVVHIGSCSGDRHRRRFRVGRREGSIEPRETRRFIRGSGDCFSLTLLPSTLTTDPVPTEWWSSEPRCATAFFTWCTSNAASAIASSVRGRQVVSKETYTNPAESHDSVS